MSEEKLYVIKSRSGDEFYFSGDRMIPNWSDNLVRLFGSYEVAKEIAEDNNGQAVTFIEEPEKVVLTKEQAEIVGNAHYAKWPATYISTHTGSNSRLENQLMNAYVNGYTVAKEKKYNVKVPHAATSYYKKFSPDFCDAGDTFRIDLDEDLAQFTEADIEHYGLQDCEKEEVTDDEQ